MATNFKSPFSEIRALFAKTGWAQDMRACMQAKKYHAEGNVWVHTEMVLHELEQEPTFKNLPQAEQKVLQLAALLHDIGKPVVSRVDETGHITAKGHSKAGTYLARRFLSQIDTPIQIREQIIALVLTHGYPPHAITRGDLDADLIRLSTKVSISLLHILTLADMRGRICTEKTDALDNISLWAMRAQELNVYAQPYTFKNAKQRILYCNKHIDSLEFNLPEFKNAPVTLVCGLPGSGKDTFIKRHLPALPVISLDALRDEHRVKPTDNQSKIVQIAQNQVKELLRKKQSFVLNMTNTSAMVRNNWINLLLDYDTPPHLIWIEPALGTILKQNKERAKPVPEQVIQDLFDTIDFPDLTQVAQLNINPNLSLEL